MSFTETLRELGYSLGFGYRRLIATRWLDNHQFHLIKLPKGDPAARPGNYLPLRYVWLNEGGVIVSDTYHSAGVADRNFGVWSGQ